jgi:hypothetical protein
MEILGAVGLVEACLCTFGDVLIPMQERYMVSSKCALASEIILATPDGTLR